MSLVIGIGGPSWTAFCWTGDQGPSQIQHWEAFHNVQPKNSALPPRSLTFHQSHSSLAYNINLLFPHLVCKAQDIWRLVVNALIDHLVCSVVCMVNHMSADALGSAISCSCAFASLPCFESLALGCDGIFYFLIPPPSFTSPSVGLCCATHLLCCLQQTCLEFRPDFLSSSSHFSFHSGHMCLEDFLESATHLRISELPHFWTWGEFALDLGQHINHHVAHKELMLQSNLLSSNHLHINNKVYALSK